MLVEYLHHFKNVDENHKRVLLRTHSFKNLEVHICTDEIFMGVIVYMNCSSICIFLYQNRLLGRLIQSVIFVPKHNS